MKQSASKIYIVMYSEGSYDDYRENIVFATENKNTASKYVRKFNRILKKWKKHYSQYETTKCGFRWIDDDFIDPYYNRWYSLSKFN